MAQDVHYIGQHGVDGVPRSPDENSMHFLSGFYHRSERAEAGEAVEKSSFCCAADTALKGLERVSSRFGTGGAR